MLLSVIRALGRRGLRRFGADEAGAWAIRVPLVTLALAAALALRSPRG